MSRQTPTLSAASTNDQTNQNDSAIEKRIQNITSQEIADKNTNQPTLALYYADYFVGFIIKFNDTNPAQIISVLQSEDQSLITARITKQQIDSVFDLNFTSNMRSYFFQLKENFQGTLISNSEEHCKNWLELCDHPKFKTFLKNELVDHIEKLSVKIKKYNLEITISRAIEEQSEILSRIENQLNTNDEKFDIIDSLAKLKKVSEANIFQ